MTFYTTSLFVCFTRCYKALLQLTIRHGLLFSCDVVCSSHVASKHTAHSFLFSLGWLISFFSFFFSVYPLHQTWARSVHVKASKDTVSYLNHLLNKIYLFVCLFINNSSRTHGLGRILDTSVGPVWMSDCLILTDTRRNSWSFSLASRSPFRRNKYSHIVIALILQRYKFAWFSSGWWSIGFNLRRPIIFSWWFEGGGVLFRIQECDGIGSLPCCHQQLGADGPARDRYSVLLRDRTGELLDGIRDLFLVFF